MDDADSAEGTPDPPDGDADLLERLREFIRLKHYSKRTERAYLDWSRRFLAYRRRTGLSGTPTGEDLRASLTGLAVNEKVSASTQNQAFNAVLFLFREVLRVDVGDVSSAVRARKKKKLPTVLSLDEVRALFAAMEPKYLLPVRLMYGSGVRLMELLQLSS